MKEYEKELYEYYEEDISKITEGINLIREGTQHIIAALKRVNSGWISVDRNLPHSNWKEIEVTTNEGERKIATYIQKRNIWIDTDYNKIEVVAWKRPSYPYRISTENSKKFKKIEYTDLATYPESFLKKAIKFSAKVEDTYWFTSEEEDFNSEYCTYYSLALENEITDKRIEVWYDPTKLKSQIFSGDEVFIYGTIYTNNKEELVIIGNKIILIL